MASYVIRGVYEKGKFFREKVPIFRLVGSIVSLVFNRFNRESQLKMRAHSPRRRFYPLVVGVIAAGGCFN